MLGELLLLALLVAGVAFLALGQGKAARAARVAVGALFLVAAFTRGWWGL